MGVLEGVGGVKRGRGVLVLYLGAGVRCCRAAAVEFSGAGELYSLHFGLVQDCINIALGHKELARLYSNAAKNSTVSKMESSSSKPDLCLWFTGYCAFYQRSFLCWSVIR